MFLQKTRDLEINTDFEDIVKRLCKIEEVQSALQKIMILAQYPLLFSRIRPMNRTYRILSMKTTNSERAQEIYRKFKELILLT